METASEPRVPERPSYSGEPPAVDPSMRRAIKNYDESLDVKWVPETAQWLVYRRSTVTGRAYPVFHCQDLDMRTIERLARCDGWSGPGWEKFKHRLAGMNDEARRKRDAEIDARCTEMGKECARYLVGLPEDKRP